MKIREEYRGELCDLVLALHAHKSAASIQRSFQERPGRRIVVALTGTDLYRDLPGSSAAQRSLEIAWRIVVLQPLALKRIQEVHHAKTRVIYQSAESTPGPHRPSADHFDIAVPGHLRDEKAPFVAAAAARLLPQESRVRILQIGRALTPEYEAKARQEQIENPRYNWLGELPRRQLRQIVASSSAVALTSVMEGGANVISEAIVDDMPVLASRIDGSIGLLGPHYAGLFNAGDIQALAQLMSRLELNDAFRTELKGECANLKPLFDPARELGSWRQLLAGD